MVVKVFVYALITAIFTGFGALPFAITRRFEKRWLGVFNAIAAGIMIGASFNLVNEGFQQSSLGTVIGLLLGLIGIVAGHKFLDAHGGDFHFGDLKGIDARKVLFLVGIMIVHSFSEGVGIGVSFGNGENFGVFISLAIAVHNIPEGLAIALVMVPRGVSWIWAAVWSVISSLPQPLMAVPSYLFVEIFQPFLPVGLGFAAGAMFWISFSEILSDAMKDASPTLVATASTLSIAAMSVFQHLIH